jgi:membrane-bound lytic murein transglycosylase D
LKQNIRHTLICVLTLMLSACTTTTPRPSAPASPHEAAARSPISAANAPAPDVAALQETNVSPWSRLRARFAMQDCDYRPQVQHWVMVYTKDPRTFAASWKHALPFLLIVTDEIERRNLPGEFAMLPYLESGYEPIASHGDRVAGMWQLMPDTAKEVGLAVGADYDARLDALDSTRGALDLIQRYHEEFSDWRLADMAFSSGEFHVRRLLGVRDAHALSAEELSHVAFKPITYSHLDRLLALSCIVNDPTRFGVALPEPMLTDRLQEVALQNDIDLRLAAHLAALPVGEVKRWNAGYRRNHMPADAPHRLLLPAVNIARFHAAADVVPAQLWSDWREERTAGSGSIGTWAARIGVPVALLAVANALDENATLAPATALLVPGREPDPAIEDDKPSAASSRHRVASKDNQPHAASPSHHVIVAGDTLSGIAHHYSIPLQRLRKLNPRAKDALRPGDHLRLSDG